MTIAGLGMLSRVPLYVAASKDAGNLFSAQGTSSKVNAPILAAASTSSRYPLDPNIGNVTDAAHVSLTAPPNTVSSGQSSSVSTEATYLASNTPTSSSSQYGVGSSATSASYDVSYNTPIATLEALGLIQQGDTLLNTNVSIQTQQLQQSETQSETASQQTTASNGAAQSSTATQSAQQTDSEQSEVAFYTQNWMTPNGQGFIFQELVRFNQSTDSTGAQSGLSNTSTPPVDAIANAIANASASPTAASSIDNAAAATNNHATTKSAAEVQLATLSTQVMNSVMNSWLQLANAASTTGSSTQSSASNSSAVASTANTDASLIASTTSNDQDALTKQTNALLALFESLGASTSATTAVSATPVETAS